MATLRAIAARARTAAPAALRALVSRARKHRTLTLAAGMAFFGILSIGPAVGVGFGLIRLVLSPDAAAQLSELLQDAFPEQLGLGELVDQMEDQAGRYAGVGLVVLLWPATTLASGWARALDVITGLDEPGGPTGLWGRLRGFIPGAILVTGMFMLLAAATFGTVLAGQLVFAAVLGGAVAFQFVFNLAIYRWLPSRRQPWHVLWPGAAWATVGVLTTTAAFALALTGAEGLAQNYPPALTTAVVLGLWLYLTNAVMLLGAEYNQVRQNSAQEEPAQNAGTR